MTSRKDIFKEPEEPEAILGDLDLDSSLDSEDSDHATIPIKYEFHTGSETLDDSNASIMPKIEISDIKVDFGDSSISKGLRASIIQGQIEVKVEKEVKEGPKSQTIGTKDFLCEDCNVQFKTIQILKRHFKSHLGPMPCQFEGCSNVSYTKNNYYSHRKSHDIQKIGPNGEVLHACTLPGCSKVYKLAHSLLTHKYLKHNPNPETIKPLPSRVKHPDRPFICEHCGRDYDSIICLKNHIRRCVREGSKGYPCTFQGCERSFKTKANLNIHLKGHNGIRDRLCEFCGVGFAANDMLNRHRLRFHLEKLPEEDREENEKKLAKMRENYQRYNKKLCEKNKIEVKSRENETEEEREARRAKYREKMKKYNYKRKDGETPEEEKKKGWRKFNELKKKELKGETPEERRERLDKLNEAWRKNYAKLDPERKAARLERYKRYNKMKRARMTKEERKEMDAKSNRNRAK